jgi:hypothetical protein
VSSGVFSYYNYDYFKSLNWNLLLRNARGLKQYFCLAQVFSTTENNIVQYIPHVFSYFLFKLGIRNSCSMSIALVSLILSFFFVCFICLLFSFFLNLSIRILELT